MKVLLVTEKNRPAIDQRDGGSRLIETLKYIYGNQITILQFGASENLSSSLFFTYPIICHDRFQQRLANADYVIEKVSILAHEFDAIIFSHISMAFSLYKIRSKLSARTILFPMFLSPSYELSNETVPIEYINCERISLKQFDQIITPSHFEKKQLIDYFNVPENIIRVVPRGLDSNQLTPTIRTLSENLIFCSVGSIKPQKNTLDLIDLFSSLVKIYPNSRLKIIGPIQNNEYYRTVRLRANENNVLNLIDFLGYVPPEELSSCLRECHIHLTMATCETFGRAIFETLAMGIPNIARHFSNAAADFLNHLPYAKFIVDHKDALNAIADILNDYSTLSELAKEVRFLYDDNRLSTLLIAELEEREILAISDFDGTLYHKNDSARTKSAIEHFHTFPKRLICSARSISDILSQCQTHAIHVDWIIGYSGAIVTDRSGQCLWTTPLGTQEYVSLAEHLHDFESIYHDDELLQLSAQKQIIQHQINCRVETYQSKQYYAHWQASKLQAILKLLNYINHQGRVRVFGDGPYDNEMITFFDGTWIN